MGGKMRNTILVSIYLLSSLCVYAEVHITVEPTQVFILEPNQLLGTLTFTVRSHDLENANETTLIRFRISNYATNQDNRVGWPSNNATIQLDPIYLPMELVNAPSGSQLVAPPDTISIIRWLESEYLIMVHVRNPTSTWIRDPQGNLVSPSNENGFVQFKIGLSSVGSYEHYLAPFLEGLCNLPGATRDLDWITNPHDPGPAESTEWLANLEHSNLAACPQPDCELRYDNIGVIGDPLVVLSAPMGEPLRFFLAWPINFTGSDVLAFGQIGRAVPTLSNGFLGLLVVGLTVCLLVLRRRVSAQN